MIVHLLPFKHDQYELVFPLLSIKSGCQSSDKERSRKLDNFLLVYILWASNFNVKSIKPTIISKKLKVMFCKCLLIYLSLVEGLYFSISLLTKYVIFKEIMKAIVKCIHKVNCNDTKNLLKVYGTYRSIFIAAYKWFYGFVKSILEDVFPRFIWLSLKMCAFHKTSIITFVFRCIRNTSW